MRIQSFIEMNEDVWKRIKKPIIAVYRSDRGDCAAKVYDGADYTGIYMEGNTVEEDIAKYARNLRRVEPGAADDPEMICAYI